MGIGGPVLSQLTEADSGGCVCAGRPVGGVCLCVCGGGCQFVFHELRKCLVFKRGSKCQ